jgi:predicted component of type VI protein secretion system
MQLLLERLAGAHDLRHSPGTAFNVLEAVRAQIQRLVGIHVWEGENGLHLMDLAIAPVVGLQGQGDLDRFLARLGALIRKHEPRLELLRVGLDPDPNPLAATRLWVVGRLRGSDEIETLSFDWPQQ